MIFEKKTIQYGRQSIDHGDIESVISVLSSDYLTQGPKVPEFEDAVSRYCGSNYAVAVNSATSALHIACLALDVKAGDTVWTSSITFAASANCARYCGANVDFLDIDSKTYNICIESLEAKLKLAETSNTLPKVLIAVHMTGQSCDMRSIHSLSVKYGFKVIEDASHAIGGEYEGKLIGNCKFSDIVIFSFHPVKIITSGEGGVAVTNDVNLARLLRLYRSHGITSEPNQMEPRPLDEIWNYQQTNLGFNYRLTDIQAALGLSQLGRINKFLSDRREIAENYNIQLTDLPLVLPFQDSSTLSSYHLYVVRLKDEFTRVTQKELFLGLRDLGIMVNLHYIPVYLHPYYRQLGFSYGYCPNAEAYFRSAISLPIYPGLDRGDLARIIDSLKSILNK